MILVIDNYDSFVYNLARYVSELGYQKVVKRNDEITIEEIRRLNPTHIIISPGPCTPNEAGISLSVIVAFGEHIPILGVCLGHQAIGQVYGCRVVRALYPMHGKSSLIQHDGKGLFKNIKIPCRVGRYHSLVVSEESFPADIAVTARCNKGEVMAIAHRKFPVWGVQFHPESVLTENGYEMMRNFLLI